MAGFVYNAPILDLSCPNEPCNVGQVACLGQYDHTIRTCVRDADINLVTGEQHNSYDEMVTTWSRYGCNGAPMTKVEFDLCKSYNMPDHDVYNIGCDLVDEVYGTCLEAIQAYMS